MKNLQNYYRFYKTFVIVLNGFFLYLNFHHLQLHFQKKYPQGKLVSAIYGEIFDVAVDIRKESKYYGHWVGEVLSEKNCNQLYIPEGFAHAYYSYEKTNVVYYKLTNYYKPNFESGINLLDNSLKIKWPQKKFEISKKDKKLISFKKFCKTYKSL